MGRGILKKISPPPPPPPTSNSYSASSLLTSSATHTYSRPILQIPTPLPHNTILVTIDVTSLYTNISNNEGIEASIKALSTLPPHTPRPPLYYFRTLLNFILKYYYFLFNNQHYLQIKGTAMGTRMAPS